MCITVHVLVCIGVYLLACGGGDPDASLAGGVLVLSNKLECPSSTLGYRSVVLETNNTHLYT